MWTNACVILAIIFVFALLCLFTIILIEYLFMGLDRLGKKIAMKIKSGKYMILLEILYIVLMMVSLISIFVNRIFSIGFNLLAALSYVLLSSIIFSVNKKYKHANSLFKKIFSDKNKIVEFLDKVFTSPFIEVFPSGLSMLSLCMLIFLSIPVLGKNFDWPISTYFIQIMSVPIITATWIYFTTGSIMKIDIRDDQDTKLKKNIKFGFNSRKEIVSVKRVIVYGAYLIFNIKKSYNEYMGFLGEKVNEDKFLFLLGATIFVVFISLDRIFKEIHDAATKKQA
ncbi:hypothetical protein [Cellulosilyticum sp. I15G10I2]|uniref:hypothetical protein n=1 Tax=Cellulosilyticum sp. I15G10I2 TaxID=1892843 RepID=UPI00085C8F7A|nr:hypothetical protein [Cellulosilyticum sp. I15G10I2]